jgi:hypothetical protein
MLKHAVEEVQLDRDRTRQAPLPVTPGRADNLFPDLTRQLGVTSQTAVRTHSAVGSW